MSAPRATASATLLVLATVTLSAGLLSFPLAELATGGEDAIEITRVAEAEYDETPDAPVFIAVVGTDERPGVGGARADAFHVLGINPALGRGTILNIPRDTVVDIPGSGRDKINTTNTFGGAQLVADTVRAFVGVDVRYVVVTNFEGFVNLIDAVGGVTVEVPVPIHDQASGADFDPGAVHMDGAQALSLARARKPFANGDFTRTAHQALLLLSALRQMQAQNPGPAETLRLMAILLTHVETHNLGIRDIYGLARLATRLDPAQVSSVTMPGATAAEGGASVVVPTADATGVFTDFADNAIVGG